MAESQMGAIEQKLFPALAAAGVNLLQEHKDAILNQADGIADSWLDKVVTAIADNLTHGGISNLEWGNVQRAVISSEPNIDQATNERIAALFAQIEATVKKAA